MIKFSFQILFLIIVLGACGGNDTTTSNLEDIRNEYPDVDEALEEVPDSVLDRFQLPEYIPFKVKEVQAMVNPEDSSQVEIVFTNGTLNLHVMSMERSISPSINKDNLMKLNNGEVARYDRNHFGKILQWSDQSQDRFYSIKLLTYKPEKEIPYSKEDLMKIANSMYSPNRSM